MIAHFIFNSLLFYSALTTLLVTGLLFTFTFLVMPGLAQMENHEFIRAFQEIDGIIQRGHPVFMAVWLGSILSLSVATFLGFGRLDGLPQGLLIAATVLYVLGVQLPTIKGNVPLNNQLQAADLSVLSEAHVAEVRNAFEDKWNRLNHFRTGFALVVSILLLLVIRLA